MNGLFETTKENKEMEPVVLTLPDVSPVEHEVKDVIDFAKSISITNQNERTMAAEFEKDLAKKERVVKAHFAPIKKALDASKKTVLDMERKYLAPIQEARGVLKKTQLDWDLEQNRLAEIERRKKQEELRLAEIARRADEAKRAKAAGDAKAAEEMLAKPIEVPVVKSEAPKQAGQSIRETWSAEVIDLGSFVRWVAQSPSRMHLIQPNAKELSALVRAEKDKMDIPGVKVSSEKTLVTRS